MRKDKVKAYELRRKGKSYSEIAKTLSISKSTLSGWFKNEDWSRDIRDKLSQEESMANPKKLARMSKAAKERWAKWRDEYKNEARIEFDKLKDNPLFISGVMLYWTEGNKTGHLKLSSSDPAIIKLFNRFLVECLGVQTDKVLAYLVLYPDLNDEMQKRFWSTASGIPIEQFRKSVYIKGRSPKRRLSYGVCNIYLNSKGLREKMLVWSDLLSRHI